MMRAAPPFRSRWTGRCSEQIIFEHITPSFPAPIFEFLKRGLTVTTLETQFAGGAGIRSRQKAIGDPTLFDRRD